MNVVKTEVVIPHRINSHSNLSNIVKAFSVDAPPVKVTRQNGVQQWEKRLYTEYHMNRMKMSVKNAESPNLTLREIQTGKNDDRGLSYFVGLAFLLFLFI
jgi:hypothetical protein